MPFPAMQRFALKAVGRGLAAAGVLSPKGRVLAVEGGLDEDELRAIAAFVSHARPADFLERLFAGELVTATVADREICLGVAARCVFVVTVFGSGAGARHATELFRSDVEFAIERARDAGRDEWIPPDGGTSGSGSAPAEAFVWPPDPKRLPN